MAGPASAGVCSAQLDNPPDQKSATLEPASSQIGASSGGASALTASTRYIVCGVPWATSRNTPNGIVLGSVYGGTTCAAHDGDVFDMTDHNSSSWLGGYSYRAHCGFLLAQFLNNTGSTGANVPCASTNMSIYKSQFMLVTNCVGCNYYTQTTWTGTAASATGCRNLIPPPQEIVPGTSVTCRDPVTIYNTDTIDWRYLTKDGKWIEIKDERIPENSGRYMFLPWTGQNSPLNVPCDPGNCDWNPPNQP